MAKNAVFYHHQLSLQEDQGIDMTQVSYPLIRVMKIFIDFSDFGGYNLKNLCTKRPSQNIILEDYSEILFCQAANGELLEHSIYLFIFQFKIE